MKAVLFGIKINENEDPWLDDEPWELVDELEMSSSTSDAVERVVGTLVFEFGEGSTEPVSLAKLVDLSTMHEHQKGWKDFAKRFHKRFGVVLGDPQLFVCNVDEDWTP